MKKLILSLFLTLGTLFAGNANSQCAANGTMTPTGNPGEFTITDLSSVPLYGTSYFIGGDGGMLYLQPSTTTGTYQYTANGVYYYYFLVMDSTSVYGCDTLAGTVSVTGITTVPSCQSSFILQQDSLNQNQYWCWNTSTPSTSASPASYFWDFGDGSSSMLAYPTHTYSGIGTYTLCLTVSFPNNCTSIYCDTIVITVKASGTTLNVLPEGAGLSLEEISSIQSLDVYPNPSNGNFVLELNSTMTSKVKLSLFNLAGQEMYSELNTVSPGVNIIQLNQESLTNGVYLLHVLDLNTQAKQTIRIMKK
jgi:hypothetical protein